MEGRLVGKVSEDFFEGQGFCGGGGSVSFARPFEPAGPSGDGGFPGGGGAGGSGGTPTGGAGGRGAQGFVRVMGW